MIGRIVAAAAIVLNVASAASAEVQLTLRDGRVTLVATDATLRQILAEWARVGQTTIVNVDRIPGGPLTLQLADMPEQEALDFLLNSVAGYMAAPRAAQAPNLSRYDRILVLPTAAMPRVPTAATASAAPTGIFQQVPQQPPQDFDNDGPSIVQPRGPLFPTQPRVVIENQQPVMTGASPTPGVVQPQPVQPELTPPNASPFVVMPPGAPAVGTPRPGMIIQPPAQQPGVIEINTPTNPDN
jgi:hypothetical protein